MSNEFVKQINRSIKSDDNLNDLEFEITKFQLLKKSNTLRTIIKSKDQLSEEQKRLAIRSEMITHNKSLAEAAQNAGVCTPKDYAIFQNKGYQGLYGGLGAKEIHARKGLKKSQKILDYMGSTELAANLFRATQTDENCAGKTFKVNTRRMTHILK